MLQSTNIEALLPRSSLWLEKIVLAVLLAMISLPDLDPEPMKTPAATVGQRLAGSNPGSAVDGMLDGPAGVGDVEFTATCGFGVMPLMGAVLGDMSALSRSLTSPACVPPQGRFGGVFASPLGYGLPLAGEAFGALGPVALPVFGVRPASAPALHLGSPGTGAFGVVVPPTASWSTVHRGVETGAEPGSWHRTLEPSAPVSPELRALPHPAPVRASR